MDLNQLRSYHEKGTQLIYKSKFKLSRINVNRSLLNFRSPFGLGRHLCQVWTPLREEHHFEAPEQFPILPNHQSTPFKVGSRGRQRYNPL